MLWCLGEHETALVLAKVHKGACGSYIGGKALTHKLLRGGYYCPTLMKDNITFVNKCDRFQGNTDLYHTLTVFPQSMISPWPFYQWG